MREMIVKEEEEKQLARVFKRVKNGESYIYKNVLFSNKKLNK